MPRCLNGVTPTSIVDANYLDNVSVLRKVLGSNPGKKVRERELCKIRQRKTSARYELHASAELNPITIKIEGKNRGGQGKHPCDHGLPRMATSLCRGKNIKIAHALDCVSAETPKRSAHVLNNSVSVQ